MKYFDESADISRQQLRDLPCPHCGGSMEDHQWRDARGILCPRWTRRLARRLGDALAAVSRAVGQ